MRKKINNKKAFTLIESIFAILIITIAFAAITRIFPMSLKVEKSAELKSRAIELAQAKIEEFVPLSYEEINCSGTNPPCEETEDPVAEDTTFRRITSIVYADPQNNLAEPTPDDTEDTGIKKVEVTLFWTSIFGADEDSVKFSTLFVDK